MSLLADHDYLLHSLRLSYLRLIVPSHSPTSTLPGTGPHNLLSFPPNDPTLSNPYVQADALADDSLWPELAAGRSSPPLGTAFAAEPRERSRRGPRGRTNRAAEEEGGKEEGARGGQGQGEGGAGGGLRYSQTIGGKVGGAGMRVSGRSAREGAASFRSSKIAERDERERIHDRQERAASPMRAENGVGSPRRRQTLESDLHNRRLSTSARQSDLSRPVPPPELVIHSPVRSPAGSVHPTRPNSLFELASAATSAGPSPGFTPDRSPELGPSTDIRDDDGSHTGARQVFGEPRQMEEGDGNQEVNGLGRGSLRLDEIRPNGPALSDGLDTRLESSAPLVESPGGISSATRTTSTSLPTPSPISPTIQSGFVPGSIASSGISLFGASLPQTLPDVATGGGLTRDRSDSETSGAMAGPSVESDTHNEHHAAMEGNGFVVEVVAPLPFRPAGRERRRVNISGRMLASIAEPTTASATAPASSGSEEDAGPPAAQRGHRRSSTEPNAVAFQVVSGKKLIREADGSSRLAEGSRTRKVSAPGVLPPPAGAPLAGLAAPAMSKADSTNSNSSLAPPPTSNGKIVRPPPSPVLTFPSRASLATMAPAAPRKSALTAMLSASAEDAGPANPFARLYGALSTKGQDGLALSVYFPHSNAPTKPVEVKVKKDLTCEEVIGVGLGAYFEEGREPPLEVGEDEEGETAKWNLRIVEDDGEVDEDFPALDRTRGVAKFGFTEFAVVRASAQQTRDNMAKQATIVRRPSRTLAPAKRTSPLPPPTIALPPPINAQPPPHPLVQGQPSLSPTVGGRGNAGLLAPAGTSFAPATLDVSSGIAVPVLLRIRLPPVPGPDPDQTRLEVPSDMYLGDVLDMLCRRHGLENPREWAMMVHYGGQEIVVPLDRTVDSLGERHELYLVRRSQVAALGGKQLPPSSTGYTNPSASIFQPQRPSVELREQGGLVSGSALLAGYETFHVQRKLPVPMGRHPRLIALDGDYVHFMPSDQVGAKGTSGRTSSYHASQVVSCGVSRRGGGSAFKVVVRRERAEKRYDFEAESAGVAAEVVGKVREMVEKWRAEEEGRR